MITELDESVLAIVKFYVRLVDSVEHRMRPVAGQDEINIINTMLHRGMMDIFEEKTHMTAEELRSYILVASVDS